MCYTTPASVCERQGYVMTDLRQTSTNKTTKKAWPISYVLRVRSAETTLRFDRFGPMRINEIVDKKVISSALLCTALGQL